MSSTGINTRKTDTLTRGDHDERAAVWSPDGTAIAFVSNRTADPDKNENSDIYVIVAHAGAVMRQLTDWKGSDDGPRWSPDGKWIAYTRSVSEDDYHMYDEPELCAVAASGGASKLLSQALDRPVMSPRWTRDGAAIYAVVADDREQYIGSFSERAADAGGGVCDCWRDAQKADASFRCIPRAADAGDG